MQIQKNLIRRLKVSRLILAVTALLMAFPLSAQQVDISLPAKELTVREVFDAIQKQTRFTVAVNKTRFNTERRVKVAGGRVALPDVMGKVLAGTGMAYTVQGDHIIIYASGEEPQLAGSRVEVEQPRSIAGTVTDEEGNALENVRVEILDLPGAAATTFANGRFQITDVPSGRNYIARLTSPDGAAVRYREIALAQGRNADVTLVFSGDPVQYSAPVVAAQPLSARPKTVTYFNRADTALHRWVLPQQGAVASVNVPQSALFQGDYLPRMAVKTNLLYWGATTPNVSLEFGLARKWTLDATVAFNPFKLSSTGVNRFWFVQPEARYWFCQRFEKHFIGLHGLYGQYNIGDIKLPFTHSFDEHRYKGWGAGAGISYGYHLPMSSRWAWEFFFGAGYVYLQYDKFRCYDCDEFAGRKSRHYFGPTKAGVSLIFMIK